jgi:glycosyltransferase involved in cell wall biosynthesis
VSAGAAAEPLEWAHLPELPLAPRLRIAMIAPPWFEIPPRGYGGIESMCFDLVQGLVAHGHRVTLLGVGHNRTDASFVRVTDVPQGERIGDAMPEVLHAAAVDRVLTTLDVDVIHDHTVMGPLMAGARRVPTLVTVHGAVVGEMGRYYTEIDRHARLVAISDAQRRAGDHLSWAGMVHNAVTVRSFPFRRAKEDFALFLGRLSPDKGLPLAVEAARVAGVPLRIAAKCIEPSEQDFFRDEVQPRLGAGVEWLGEVGGQDKLDLLASARCLLFPICWDEPFGMVMIEALACGTPVVALRRGSVPEVLTDGVTGIVCDAPEDLPRALLDVGDIDAERCRDEAANRFDTDVMVTGYVDVYRRLARRPALIR